MSYVGRGLWISLAQVASALINGADVLIIGKLFGPLAVVPYACTGKVVIVLANQPNLLMAVAQPGLTELKSGSSPERVLQAITALTQALLGVSGLIGCTVLAVNAGFVSWWVGPKQYGGGLLTALFILNMLLRHWNTTLTYSVFCFGHERRLCFTTLLDGLVTAGMALLLASKLGPIGAPIGCILGVGLVSLPGNLNALKREVGLTVGNLLAPMWPWFWRFALLFAATGILARNWSPRGFIQIVIVAAITAAAYLGVMVRQVQESALGMYIRPRVIPLWNRFKYLTSTN
ncbi:MAG: hypothetical protein C5B51_27385 [Terriglobia bacterium]|nr:MAG: hypothetical protein C5B51_27385 [Terriglobia bacterium]